MFPEQIGERTGCPADFQSEAVGVRFDSANLHIGTAAVSSRLKNFRHRRRVNIFNTTKLGYVPSAPSSPSPTDRTRLPRQTPVDVQRVPVSTISPLYPDVSRLSRRVLQSTVISHVLLLGI